MRKYAFCPVSSKMVNERVARLNATFTVLIIVLFIFTSNIYLIWVLAADFLIRGIDFPQYSPLAIISKGVVRTLSIRPQNINAGPKLFAARIGLLLSVMILILSIAGINAPAILIATVLGLFSFLEAAFGFCVACKIYPFVYQFFYNERPG